MEDNTATTQLRQLLMTYFTLAELHELCFDMGFDFENLPNIYGEKPRNVIALIKILHGQNRLPEFVELCRQKRPRVDWPAAPTKLYFEEDIQAEAKLQDALDEYKKYIRGKWGRDSLLDRPLTDFYIPLQGQGPAEKKLKEDNSASEKGQDSSPESTLENSKVSIQDQKNHNKKEPQFILQYPLPLDLQEALKKHERLIVLGTAGTGKSTFLRHLVHQKTSNNDSAVPIWVSLADFAKVIENPQPGAKTRLKQWAIETAHEDPTIQAILNRAVEENQVLWLLDGFDETGNQINKVADAIAQLPSQNQLVLTTRPDTVKEHQHRFNATQYEMRDLSQHDVQQFLQKWFDDQDKTSDALKWLTDADHPQRQELITKPLHLVLLATIAKETSRDDFPETLVQLYGKFIDIFLDKRIKKKRDSNGVFQLGMLKRDEARAATIKGFHCLGWVLFHQEKELSTKGITIGKQVIDCLKRAEHSNEDAEAILSFWQEAGVQKSFHQILWPYAVACKLYDDWQKDAENTWRFLSSATRDLPYASRLHHPAWQEPILMLAALMGEKKQLNEDNNQLDVLIGHLLRKRDKEERYTHQNLRLAAAILGEVGVGKVNPRYEKQIINLLGQLSQSYNWKRAFIQFSVYVAAIVALYLLLPLWTFGSIMFLWLYGTLSNDYRPPNDLLQISGMPGMVLLTALRFTVTPIITVLSLPAYFLSWIEKKHYQPKFQWPPDYTRLFQRIGMFAGCTLIVFIFYTFFPLWVLGIIFIFWLFDGIYWLLNRINPQLELLLAAKTGQSIGQVHRYISTCLINLFKLTTFNTNVYLESLAKIGHPAVPKIKRLLKANSLDVHFDTIHALPSEVWDIVVEYATEMSMIKDDWGLGTSEGAAIVAKIKHIRNRDVLEQFLSHELWEVRYAAAFALSQMGESIAIYYLLKSLERANDTKQEEIRNGLASIGKSDISSLETYLSHQSENQWIIIDALGLSGNPAAIPILNNLLVNHEDIYVRRQAAWSLGHFGKAAVSELVDALDHCDRHEVRESIVEALGQSNDKALIPVLLNSLKSDHHWSERRAAAKALKYINDTTVIEPLINTLKTKGDDDSVREAAAQTLGQIGDVTTAQFLAHMLEYSLVEVDEASIIWVLGEIGEEVAVAALIQAVREDSHNILNIMRNAFARHGFGSESQQRRINRRFERRRKNAVLALGKIGSKQAIDSLIQVIRSTAGDGDLYDLHNEAYLALAKIDDAPNAPYVMEAFENGSDGACEQLKEFLKQADPIRSIPQLVTLLASDNGYANKSAEEILPDIGRPAVKPLCDVYRNSEDSEAQYRIVEVLGKIRNRDAVPLLVEALENSDKSVSHAAAQALASIGSISNKGFEKLVEVFNDRQKSYLHAETAVALGRLAESIIDKGDPQKGQDSLESARKALWQRRFAHYKGNVFLAYEKVVTSLTIAQVRQLSPNDINLSSGSPTKTIFLSHLRDTKWLLLLFGALLLVAIETFSGLFAEILGPYLPSGIAGLAILLVIIIL